MKHNLINSATTEMVRVAKKNNRSIFMYSLCAI